MYYAGIDLGGTGIKAALVTREGEILQKETVPTGADRHWTAIMADMVELIWTLAARQGIDISEIRGVGLGVPGSVDPEHGKLLYAANLPNCADMDARTFMQRELGLPLYIDNDANVAALGESLFGAGKGNDRCCVMITLGTGVGGGVIINGRIFAGAYYGGAELRHTVIVENGRPCNCGRRGCWETYSSATGLIRSAREAAAQDLDSLLWNVCDHDLSKLTARKVCEAVDEGDPTANRIMDEYLHHLAVGLGNIYNIFQPEILILGGGVSGRGEKLLVPLRGLIRSEIYGHDMSKVDIRIATRGNDAGVLGAAALVMQEE
ncbi:MAG: ROK family protein [Firmicutes bacterium]|nr:ROK family protein [Bacillota bacterium]